MAQGHAPGPSWCCLMNGTLNMHMSGLWLIRPCICITALRSDHHTPFSLLSDAVSCARYVLQVEGFIQGTFDLVTNLPSEIQGLPGNVGTLHLPPTACHTTDSSAFIVQISCTAHKIACLGNELFCPSVRRF